MDPKVVFVGGRYFEQHELACGECSSPMRLDVEGRPRYVCTRDGCRGVHGAHPDGSPMGVPADARTRRERTCAHEMFDRIWRSGGRTRTEAYAWMRERMGISKDEAHIGRMDVRQCQRLQALIREDFPELCPLDPEEA